MAEHVVEWLNAYLDGELAGRRLEHVETHLTACQECQAELSALRRLSQVVQTVPLPDEFPTADRFTAQLMLRLPRHPDQPVRQIVRQSGWWLVPAAILGSWAFIQTVFLLTGWIWTIGQAGLLGEVAGYLSPVEAGTPVLTSAFQWLGLIQGGANQQVAQISENLGWNIITHALLQGALDVLYIGWLTVWWLRLKREATPALSVQTGGA